MTNEELQKKEEIKRKALAVAHLQQESNLGETSRAMEELLEIVGESLKIMDSDEIAEIISGKNGNGKNERKR